MNKIRLRTKIEVILVSLFFMGIIFVSVLAGPRIITDISDNVDTFIHNSNGKYWSATSSNIQLAINDLNNKSGTVWLPGNTTFIVTSTIIVNDNIELDMNKALVVCATDGMNVIELRDNASIHDGDIQTLWPFSDTKQYAVIYIQSSINEWKATKTRTVKNMRLYGDSGIPAGYGIHLRGTTDGHSIYYVEVENVVLKFHYIGIYLNQTGTAWVNANTFDNIRIDQPYYGIVLETEDTEAVAGNTFTNLQISPASWSIACINLTSYWVYGNYFQGFIWDWNAAYDIDNTRSAINISGGSNYIDIYVGNQTIPQSGIIRDTGTANVFINRLMRDYALQINKINITTELTIPISLPGDPSDGTMYFVTGNQSLAVYYNRNWYFYDHT